MKKTSLNCLLFAFLLAAHTAAAQQNDCYESLLAKGKTAYNQKDYPKALLKWRAALNDCPDLTATQKQTLRDWIRKAENPAPDPVRTQPAPTVPNWLAFVKGGTFTMGDAMGDNLQTDETPHSVTVADFYISKYEVTFDDYDAFCAATGREKPADSGWGRGQRPVINVSWYDAIEYCNWRSNKDGLQACYAIDKNTKDPNNQNTGDTQKWSITCDWTKNGYRLPTEAEWEYAAREGGKKVRFGNGRDVIDPSEINFDARSDYKKSFSIVGEYRQKTVPVNQLSYNALGLYHMSGNVWEWCWDWYDASYYAQSDGARQPRGASGGQSRVVRGGSWDNFPVSCRAAFRGDRVPSYRNSSLGFRVVRHL